MVRGKELMGGIAEELGKRGVPVKAEGHSQGEAGGGGAEQHTRVVGFDDDI
jgi:hypothetical protein